jgi:hypothetical protein
LVSCDHNLVSCDHNVFPSQCILYQLNLHLAPTCLMWPYFQSSLGRSHKTGLQLLCWYFWNCWPSLLELAFHNTFPVGAIILIFSSKMILVLKDSCILLTTIRWKYFNQREISFTRGLHFSNTISISHPNSDSIGTRSTLT